MFQAIRELSNLRAYDILIKLDNKHLHGRLSYTVSDNLTRDSNLLNNDSSLERKSIYKFRFHAI